MQPTAAVRLCPRCARHLPLAMFAARSKSASSPQAWCKSCFGGYHQARRAAKRAGRLKAGVRKVRRAGSPAALHAVVADLGRQFGGASGLARELYTVAQSAAATGAHAAAARVCDTVCQLICAAALQRAAAAARRQAAVDDMTDGEVHATLSAAIGRWLAEHRPE